MEFNKSTFILKKRWLWHLTTTVVFSCLTSVNLQARDLSFESRRMLRKYLGNKILSTSDMDHYIKICSITDDQIKLLYKRNKTPTEVKQYLEIIKFYQIEGSIKNHVVTANNLNICKEIRDIIIDGKDQDSIRFSIEQMKIVLPICFIDKKELNKLYTSTKSKEQKEKWLNVNQLDQSLINYPSSKFVKDWNSQICKDARVEIENREIELIVSEAYTKVKHDIKNLPVFHSPSLTNKDQKLPVNENHLTTKKLNTYTLPQESPGTQENSTSENPQQNSPGSK